MNIHRCQCVIRLVDDANNGDDEDPINDIDFAVAHFKETAAAAASRGGIKTPRINTRGLAQVVGPWYGLRSDVGRRWSSGDTVAIMVCSCLREIVVRNFDDEGSMQSSSGIIDTKYTHSGPALLYWFDQL